MNIQLLYICIFFNIQVYYIHINCVQALWLSNVFTLYNNSEYMYKLIITNDKYTMTMILITQNLLLVKDIKWS